MFLKLSLCLSRPVKDVHGADQIQGQPAVFQKGRMPGWLNLPDLFDAEPDHITVASRYPADVSPPGAVAGGFA
jgi:hypothetical protein